MDYIFINVQSMPTTQGGEGGQQIPEAKKVRKGGGVFFCQNNLAKFGGVTLSKRCSYIHKKTQIPNIGFYKKNLIFGTNLYLIETLMRDQKTHLILNNFK